MRCAIPRGAPTLQPTHQPSQHWVPSTERTTGDPEGSIAQCLPRRVPSTSRHPTDLNGLSSAVGHKRGRAIRRTPPACPISVGVGAVHHSFIHSFLRSFIRSFLLVGPTAVTSHSHKNHFKHHNSYPISGSQSCNSALVIICSLVLRQYLAIRTRHPKNHNSYPISGGQGATPHWSSQPVVPAA